MSTLQAIIDNALTLAAQHHPRATYLRDVLTGHQCWSGADIKGKASKYGVWYARQRAAASHLLAKAGGDIIPVEHGRLVSAVCVGQDDYGDAIYRAHDGVYRPGLARRNFRRLK